MLPNDSGLLLTLPNDSGLRFMLPNDSGLLLTLPNDSGFMLFIYLSSVVICVTIRSGTDMSTLRQNLAAE